MNQDNEPRRLKILLHRRREWVEPQIIERGRDYCDLDYVGAAIHADVLAK